ncbi:NlpC/P60 family protein [Pseudonocardia sp. NPDC049154]|uniref:aggregation-promoting factor C-terminal-like domain-containing protein n=1 Tax=Pseudonocardia sp. NPDC049154 TaxID=3155501 RepID=UPI0033FB1F0F
MADRVVNTKLKMDSRDYVSSANKAADATDDLRKKAERFAGRKYEAKVGVDGAAKAAAEVAELKSRLDRLQKQYTAKVNMDMRGAQRDVALIMNSITALGPAAVAAAGVAGGALLGLGATVGTLGAGLGVLVGGLWGVGDALKAMGDADRSAGQNAAESASQRRNATRAVETARAAVVRAEQDQRQAVEQNAAASAAATRRVEDAEEDLAAAHQRTTYALEALNEARQQAIRDMEDMRERSSDLALDEREANLRLKEAREELTKAEKNGATSANDLEKARIDVLRAEDRLSDVQRDRTRNTVDLNKAEAGGVEGMAGVVSAKRSLADAERGVGDAQKDLILAQAEVASTQRENAQRTQDAALRVQEAQARLSDAVADASDAMGKQSTEAKKLQETLDALSPAGQSFVAFLYSLRPQLKELQSLAQAGMLPGFEDGIRDLMVILPEVEYLVSKTSEALGTVAREGGKAFSDPFWREYTLFIANQAQPVLTGFFSITEKLARGVASLQMAFNPMAKDVIGGLDDMADRFAKWSASLSASDGFHDFIRYVEEMAPKVFDTIGSIAGAIGEIAVAAAPLGGPVLAVIKGLAEALGFIASIPGVGTTLLAAASAMGMLNLALRGIEIAKFSRLGQFIGDLPGKSQSAAIHMGTFTEKLTGSANAGERVMTATGKMGKVLSNLGPIMAGVGAALALVAWQYEVNRSKAEDYADAVTSGSMTIQDAIAKEAEVIKGRSALGHLFAGSVGAMSDAQELQRLATENVTNALIAQSRAVDPVQRATASATLAQMDYNREVARFGADSPQAIGALGRYQSATRDVEISQIMARDGVDRMTAAVIYQNQVLTGAVSADMAAERAMLTFDQTNARATETLKTHSAASLEGRDAILAVKESAVQAAQAAGEKAAKDAEASGAADGAARSAQAQRDTYLELAAKVKEPLRSELIALADRVQTLPDGNFTVTGDGKVNLPQWKAPDGSTWTIDPQGVTSSRVGGLATGGMVDTVLPGYTPGRDVHTFYSPTAGFLGLSGGEGILRPEATKAIGGAVGLERINRAARAGGTPSVARMLAKSGQAFADGGVFMTGNPMPDIAMKLHGGISSALIAGMKPFIADKVRKLEEAAQGGGNALEWARGEVGKPYIWGGVGPAGYDCSGFMSAVMNVMNGLPPHSRVGSTSNFPWPGGIPGPGPGLTIGSTKNAGGGIGHMAGSIMGVNIESRGGRGVIVGPEARSPMDRLFNEIFHYPAPAGVVGGVEGGGPVREQVRAVAARYGWNTGAQWAALDRLIQKESSWNPNARNPRSSAAGLFQKMQSIHGPVEPTPGGQALWGLNYIRGRYGDPIAALAFHNARGHYDRGGIAKDKGLLAKATVEPERVLSPRQTAAFERLVDVISRPRRVAYTPSSGVSPQGGAGGRNVTINNENHFRETVDVDLFNQRTEFAIQGAGL